MSGGSFSVNVLAAITAINTGRVVVVEGGGRAALVSFAAAADPAAIALHESTCESPVMAVLGSERFDELQLRAPAGDRLPAAIAVSVDAEPFVGMSRAGRARTARFLASGKDPGELHRPGHLSPIRASPGGLLNRVGLAEGAADLMRLAGQPPAALISYFLDDEGARTPSDIGVGGTIPTVTLQELRSARLLQEDGQPVTTVEAVFLDAMVRMPSGVAVVTARDEDARPVGLVVSSVISYSNDPPSVLTSIAHSSRSHATLASADDFGINMLASGQADLAKIFASKADDKFAGVSWAWEGGVPRLDGVQTFLRCRRIADFSFGDHTIIIGALVAGSSQPTPPLVYVNRAFDRKLM